MSTIQAKGKHMKTIKNICTNIGGLGELYCLTVASAIGAGIPFTFFAGLYKMTSWHLVLLSNNSLPIYLVMVFWAATLIYKETFRPMSSYDGHMKSK